VQIPANLSAFRGDGNHTTVFTTPNNIMQFSNSTAGSIQSTVFQDVGFQNTYPVGARNLGATNYHVYLVDAVSVVFNRVWFKSAFLDNQYNIGNAGGLYMDNNNGSTNLDTIENSWFQNCQLLMKATDSSIINNALSGATQRNLQLKSQEPMCMW